MRIRILIRSALIGAALLSAAPLAAQKNAAPAPFRVERTGSGRAMILIPGLMSSGEVWQGTVEHFRGRYQMHVLTLAGFAGQPPLSGERYLEVERDAIIHYIREQKLKQPVLVGHSLGAFLAYSIAAAAPDLVGPVVAVDGVPYLAALGDASATPERMRPQAEQMAAVYRSFTPAQMGAQSLLSMRGLANDSATWVLGARWAEASDPATAGRALAEMMTTDLREQVAAIRSPVLLIAAVGGFSPPDQPAALARFEEQLARVPNRQVAMATRARHFVMYDDPEFLFSTMDRFLAGR
jgi:pimeloyl-ACP methyl ester carboxylesterase